MRFDPSVPTPLRIAALVLGIEIAGLVGAAVFVVVDASTNVTTALFTALLFLIAAAVLALTTRGLLRLSPAVRSPIVVIELLWLPIGYDLAFNDNRAAFGAPIMFAALAVLYLLFTPPARAALDREPPS